MAWQFVQEKKAAIKASTEQDGNVERKSVHGRDLLTLLIKANMASDIPRDQRLSEEEVLSRMLFLFFTSEVLS